jgi:hypothetical protein
MLSENELSQPDRTVDLGKPELRIVNGETRNANWFSLEPFGGLPWRKRVTPTARWIHPHNMEILREPQENLVARLPASSPSVVNLGDYAHGREKRLIQVSHLK